MGDAASQQAATYIPFYTPWSILVRDRSAVIPCVIPQGGEVGYTTLLYVLMRPFTDKVIEAWRTVSSDTVRPFASNCHHHDDGDGLIWQQLAPAPCLAMHQKGLQAVPVHHLPW